MSIQGEDELPPADGRRARRERNRTAVLDCVVSMFTEESMIPTIEQAAQRSGLSLRSIYRYFEDGDALVEAAIERSLEAGKPLAHIESIGKGPLASRIDRFLDVRMKLYEHSASSFQATVHNATRSPRIRDALDATRRGLREQFELQFAPELQAMDRGSRDHVVAVGDVLTQFDSIDLLRRYRRLTVAETTRSLRRALTTVIGATG